VLRLLFKQRSGGVNPPVAAAVHRSDTGELTAFRQGKLGGDEGDAGVHG
jgi:hypothetical protein